MLPQNRRIKKENIEQVIKKGRAYHTPLFYVKYLSNKEEKTAFAIVISSKTVKKAVVRNKIRRQIKGFLLNSLNQIKDGFNVVFIVKPDIKKVTKKELQDAIIESLIKNKII